MNILNDVLGGGSTPQIEVHVDIPDNSLIKIVGGIILAGVLIIGVWFLARKFS